MAAEKMPDFVIIGAGKSGTTSLNNYLKQHPDIFMSVRKEPNFFALEMVNPEEYELESSRQYYHQSVSTLEEYQKLFEGARAEQLLGEVSNTYLNSDMACERIQHYIPEAKLIAILRDPAERLYSRYYHLVREDVLHNLSWDQLLDKDTEWWKRQDLVDEGFYYKNLQKYFHAFPAENIKLIRYSDFTQNTGRVVNEVLEFLNLSTEVPIDTETVYNKSGTVKNESLNKVVGQNSAPIRLLKSVLPGIHKQLKKSVWANKILYHFRNKNLDKPSMPQDLRRTIIEDLYRKDIEQLAQFLDWDLKAWLHYNTK